MVSGLSLQWETLSECISLENKTETVSLQDTLLGYDMETLPVFATTDPQSIMVNGMIHSLRSTLQATVQDWRRQMEKTVTATTTDANPLIWVYGPHAHVLRHLLRPQSSDALIPDTWELKDKRDHLAHYGIAAVLRQRLGVTEPPLHQELVGLRVAQPAGTNNSLKRRLGTVTSVRRASYPWDHYRVHYDDGGSEELDLRDLAGKKLLVCRQVLYKHFIKARVSHIPNAWCRSRTRAISPTPCSRRRHSVSTEIRGKTASSTIGSS